jgi:rhamnosyltransferase subunit B
VVEKNVGARVLFVTWGSLGDLHPYMSLALELQRRGHRPAIATLAGYREVVEAAGLRCHPIRPDVSVEDKVAFQRFVGRVLDARDGPRFLFQEVFNPTLRDTYDDTVAAMAAEGGVDLLVSHQVPVTTPIVAEKTRTRWVSGVLLPMALLSAHDPATPPQAPWLQPIMARHLLLGRAMSWLGRRITRAWVKPIHQFRRDLGLPAGSSPIFEGQH